MKKGKIITKSQLAVIAMVLVLGAAVALNMKYSGKLTREKVKYMGEASYVSASSEEEAVATAATPGQEDVFESARKEREEAYTKAQELLREATADVNFTEEQKKEAVNRAAEAAKRSTDEAAVEAVLTAKGFEKCLTIIGDDGVTVLVESGALSAAQTVQIQDAVTGQCGTELSKIKIVTVNG